MLDVSCLGIGRLSSDASWGFRLIYWTGEWSASGVTEEDEDFGGNFLPGGTPFESRMRVQSGAVYWGAGGETRTCSGEAWIGLGAFRARFKMETPLGKLENSDGAPLTAGALRGEWRPLPFLFLSGGASLTGFGFSGYDFYGELEVAAGVRCGPVYAEFGYRRGGYFGNTFVGDPPDREAVGYHILIAGPYLEIGVRF